MQKKLAMAAILAVLVLAAVTGWAQAQDDSKPAPSNVGNSPYPRIHADGRVTFRVKAPMAQKVSIEPTVGRADNNGISGLGKGPFEMTKDADGYWTVTTGPARPGLYEYWVNIDGLRVADPSSDSYGALNTHISAIEIPDPAGQRHLRQCLGPANHAGSALSVALQPTEEHAGAVTALQQED
jgi:hypothetical protein